MIPPFTADPDLLFIHCHLARLDDGTYDMIRDGALAVAGNTIIWTGTSGEALSLNPGRACSVIDCKGHWLMPGFVDCHTHLVWGGSRSGEFEMRLGGASYEEIAINGGGIASTVQATRQESENRLFESAKKRVDWLFAQGVTTLEIKTGYGLDLESELKMLRVIDRLNRKCPADIHATFLGAHALPPEFTGRSREYIDLVTRDMLPAVKKQGIATAVDAFCDAIGFSTDDTRQVFERARELGFSIKLHAEQLSDSSGAAMASAFNALSCDHLEYLSPEGARAMANAHVVPVLLPGAFYYLKQTQKPPVSIFRELDMPIAVSTDLNPGSSPVHSVSLILNMACQLFGLTPAEALSGMTLNGARALGVADRKGSLAVGKDADLVVWDIHTPADLCYLAGYEPVRMVVKNGTIVLDTLPA